MTIDGVAARVDVGALFRQHHLALVRLAVLLVDDTASAEDVVQDAFAGLHKRVDRLRDPDAALAYLRAATVNGARSALRRRRTVRSYLRAAEPEAGEAADARAMLAVDHAQVLAAVRTLPPRDQEVLALRYWSGCTEAEIANALGVSPGTVKSTASRAVAKLEQILNGMEADR